MSRFSENSEKYLSSAYSNQLETGTTPVYLTIFHSEHFSCCISVGINLGA